MGYRHISNLYKNKHILNFRECYALEKVHGTSAHVGLELVHSDPTYGSQPADVKLRGSL